jgi:hypothetical protein
MRIHVCSGAGILEVGQVETTVIVTFLKLITWKRWEAKPTTNEMKIDL